MSLRLDQRRWVPRLGGLLLAIAAAAVGGCSKPRPAAESASLRAEGETVHTRVMTSRQQRDAQQAFAELAHDAVAHAVPAPAASERGRRSDVHLAVLYACDEIEAAVVRRIEHTWGVEYRFRTAEDWPGTLWIRSAGPQRVYEATASVGIYGDRTERADELLAALERLMRDFGRKHKLPED